MSIIKGRWPKSEAKRESRAIDRLGGFNRSRGAASKCVHVELTEAERAELLAKYGDLRVNVAER